MLCELPPTLTVDVDLPDRVRVEVSSSVELLLLNFLTAFLPFLGRATKGGDPEERCSKEGEGLWDYL